MSQYNSLEHLGTPDTSEASMGSSRKIGSKAELSMPPRWCVYPELAYIWEWSSRAWRWHSCFMTKQLGDLLHCRTGTKSSHILKPSLVQDKICLLLGKKQNTSHYQDLSWHPPGKCNCHWARPVLTEAKAICQWERGPNI